jgi:hypothetical protein
MSPACTTTTTVEKLLLVLLLQLLPLLLLLMQALPQRLLSTLWNLVNEPHQKRKGASCQLVRSAQLLEPMVPPEAIPTGMLVVEQLCGQMLVS